MWSRFILSVPPAVRWGIGPGWWAGAILRPPTNDVCYPSGAPVQLFSP